MVLVVAAVKPEPKHVSQVLTEDTADINHTLRPLRLASSASSNVVVLPSTSKHSFLIMVGVGEAAKGYCLGSISCRCFGGFSSKGGKLVVVVVVVVTTMVWVAEIWPTTACGLGLS